MRMRQTYGQAACPVLTLDKIYDEASLVTEHKIKASCLLLGGRLERPKKVKRLCMKCIEHA